MLGWSGSLLLLNVASKIDFTFKLTRANNLKSAIFYTDVKIYEGTEVWDFALYVS